MITFRQLEIFATTVGQGSFRRCAEHLGISPEAVSANMRALEEQLDYLLFERHAGGPATLTARGARAFELASNILDDLGFLFDASGPGVPHQLVVGAHAYTMRYLQSGIDAFCARHPEVKVELDIDSAGLISFPEKVERRMIDLGYYLAYDQGSDVPSAFDAVVGLEQLAIFVAEDHYLTRQQVVTVEHLIGSGLPVVHLSRRTALRPLIDKALEHYGLGEVKVGVVTDDYGHILSSVKRGEGFVCMFASSESEAGDRAGIVRLPMQQPLPALQVRRASRSLQRGALVTELEALLRATFKNAS